MNKNNTSWSWSPAPRFSYYILLFAISVGMIRFTAGHAYELGRQAAGHNPTPEIVALSEARDFLNTLDPLDANVWTSLREFGRVCDNCSALAEFEHQKTLPIVVSHHDPGTSVGYTLVLGVVNYDGKKAVVVPVMRYYVGTQGGSRLRIDENGQAAVMRGLSWGSVKYAEQPQMIAEIRKAMIRERLSKLPL